MKKIGLISSVIALALGFAYGSSDAATFRFATAGRANAVIVAEPGTNGYSYAANELAKYLGKITGATFMVTDKPVKGYKTILVGTPYKAAKKEELCFRFKNDDTMEFTGDGTLGTLYAVYDFLETQGVVFSANDYEYIPSIPDLAVSTDLEKVDAPCMEWRDIWGVISFDTPYAMKLRLHTNSDKKLWSLFGNGPGADIAQTVPTYWVHHKKFYKDHPDWYAYVKRENKRMPLWICISSDGMFEQLFKEIDEEMKKNPNRKEISLGLTDTPYLCECDKCLEFMAKYPDAENVDAFDIQLVELANRAGRHFAKKYPNLTFVFLNYGGRMPDNSDYKLEPNVRGAAAELWRNHALPTDCNERSSFALQRVAKMSNPDKGPWIWEYYCNFASYLIPFPNLYTFGDTARYYKAIGVKGAGAQAQMCIHGDMASLHYWLYGKLLWNPDADEKELVRHYIKYTYGAAAPMIQEYVDLLEHARLRQRHTWYGCYVDTTEHYLTDQDCIRIFQLFTKAEHAIRKDPTRRHLVKRAKMACVVMTMFRYYDMLALAQKQRVKLPTPEALVNEYYSITGDSMHFARLGDWAEGGYGSPDSFKKTWVNGINPSVRTNCSSSVVVTPQRMLGGKKMTKQRDKDGTEYAQFKVDLVNDKESFWMNPDNAEIHFDATAAEAGEWYVFATVRIGATWDDDKGAAYFGHYQPSIVNGVTLKRLMETADMTVQANKADNGKWRTLCLGMRRLVPGSRIWVMPGVLHKTDYHDVQSFTLIAPSVLNDPKATAKSENKVFVYGPRDFDKGTDSQTLKEPFDNFDYTRVTNNIGKISYTIKDKDVGEWHVLVDVRSGANKALESYAGEARIISNDQCTECGKNQTPVKWNITGSRGDESWQTISLGTVKLEKGMRIEIAPGAEGVTRFTDVRRIRLVSPAYFKATQP